MDCGKEVLHFGDTMKPMTRRQRITVTNTDELANALERMRPYFPDKPAAALVHDLAIKGAVTIEDDDPLPVDDARHREAIERLIWWSTSPDSTMDREALLRAEEGWGWNR
jgi:hypothetical protein